MGVEVDHFKIMLMPPEAGEGLPIRQVRPLPEVLHLPGIMAIPTTPGAPVRGGQEDLLTVIAMELMAMPDGSSSPISPPPRL